MGATMFSVDLQRKVREKTGIISTHGFLIKTHVSGTPGASPTFRNKEFISGKFNEIIFVLFLLTGEQD